MLTYVYASALAHGARRGLDDIDDALALVMKITASSAGTSIPSERHPRLDRIAAGASGRAFQHSMRGPLRSSACGAVIHCWDLAPEYPPAVRSL